MLPIVLLLACAQPPPPCPGLPGEIPVNRGISTPGADWDALEEAVVERMEQGCIPALSLAMVDEQRVRWSAAFGWADLERDLEATPETAFMLASTSKAVDGVALMLAREQGLLDLDDPVSDHLDFEVRNPRLGSRQPPIRLAHLATHSSGIRDNWDVLDATYVDGDPTVTLGDFLEGYLTPDGDDYHAGANFYGWEPGRQWVYANTGAALAAYTVQEASGQPYEALCDEQIFAPLAMENTHWFLADYEDLDQVAVPYAQTDEGWQAHEHYGFATWPDGQLRSTAGDMGALLGMVMAGGTWQGQQVLAPGSVETMLAPPHEGLVDLYLRSWLAEQYVFWFAADQGERRLIGHDGDDRGVSTEMFYDPEVGVGAVVIMNQGDWEGGGAAREATMAIEQSIYTLGEQLKEEGR